MHRQKLSTGGPARDQWRTSSGVWVGLCRGALTQKKQKGMEINTLETTPLANDQHLILLGITCSFEPFFFMVLWLSQKMNGWNHPKKVVEGGCFRWFSFFN